MIILIFSIFLFLSATFGYGRLFLRINRLDDLNLSFGETGILGLFFLAFIGLSLHFFFPLGQNLNFIIVKLEDTLYQPVTLIILHILIHLV